ncbi:FAD/NAD(P)-binding domain-containing protein [Aspergillus alliaceus]|uniref:FAD/NAD(P)-binding domain-containing protein n=1 Tax=Petromyces alliaceus TaxID=209559 RepID=A0A5N7CAH8_PETAA|nr:FAD/NAD(P)-binding domain-containing protein [Aspergillus alliaceus]
MSKSEFQVIIVGGSIGGLTLAHCLQHAGIDHIVLEKASNPAPQVGASIGILPNGARVLDQLQLYDQIERSIEPLETAIIGYPDGFSFSSSYPKIINKRFGFPIAFLDRQRLLEILYQNYPDGSKIRLGEKVTAIHPSSGRVTVTTAKGSVYHGQLVIGADGVHSQVREAIWRAVENMSSSSAIAKDRFSLTVEFRCMFGISSAIKGLNVGEQVNKFLDGLTIVTIHGKKGRVYWFVIQKLSRKYIYPNGPRYTADDINAAAEVLRNIQVHQDITFGQIWENRETVSMTALEENTLKTWYHGRLVLLGDSVHKMTPNIGQGANMAIEDAAALANLLRRLRISPGTTLPTDGQIETLLRQYRSIRYHRVDSIYRSSQFLVRFQARDGLLNTLFGRYYAPYAGDLPADMASKTIADGVICDFLPPPKRCGGGWEQYRRKTPRWGWEVQTTLSILVLAILYAWIGRGRLHSMVFDGCGSLLGVRKCPIST